MVKSFATVLAVIMFLLASKGRSEEVFTLNGKEVTKGEALIGLAKDPKADVKRITDLKLSDKGTMVKR